MKKIKDLLSQIPIFIAVFLIISIFIMVFYSQYNVYGFPALLKIDYYNETVTILGNEYVCNVSFVKNFSKVLKSLWDANKYIIPPKRQ